MTPVLADQLARAGARRAVPALHARRAARVPPPGRRGPRRGGAARGRAVAAPLGARLRVGGGRLRAPRRRPARRRCGACTTRARSSCGRRPPPTRCCRCSPPSRACACRSRPASTRTASASARGAAGSGCRSAPTAPASRSRSRRPACGRSASTRPATATPLDQLEPVAAGGAVAMPIDWQTIALVWDEHGYPADPAYRDYHAQTRERDARVDQRRRPVRPRRGRAPARASTPRDFVDRVIARPTHTGPRGRGPPWWFARSTPSCSVTGGTRGRCGWRR